MGKFHRAFGSRSEVDPFEERADRRRRIKSLEKDPEEWFKYYFDKYCTAPPAPFHTRSTRRILANPEWYEVRAWSRELAKSVRTMMEVCYLVLTKRKHTVLLISNSQNNAERLLAPYREFFERSERMINDYGRQNGQRPVDLYRVPDQGRGHLPGTRRRTIPARIAQRTAQARRNSRGRYRHG